MRRMLVEARLEHLDLFAQEWTKINQILDKNLANINELLNEFGAQSSHSQCNEPTIDEDCHLTGLLNVQCTNNHHINMEHRANKAEGNKSEDDDDSSEFCENTTLNSDANKNGEADDVNKASSINSFSLLGGELSSERCSPNNTISWDEHNPRENPQYPPSILYNHRKVLWKWHRSAEYSGEERYCKNCKQLPQNGQCVAASFSEQKSYYATDNLEHNFALSIHDWPSLFTYLLCRSSSPNELIRTVFCDFCRQLFCLPDLRQLISHTNYRSNDKAPICQHDFAASCVMCGSAFVPNAALNSCLFSVADSPDEILIKKLVFILTIIHKQLLSPLGNKRPIQCQCLCALSQCISCCFKPVLHSLWNDSSPKTLFERSIFSAILLFYSLRLNSLRRSPPNSSTTVYFDTLLNGGGNAPLQSILSVIDYVILSINSSIFSSIFKRSLNADKGFLLGKLWQTHPKRKINRCRRKKALSDLIHVPNQRPDIRLSLDLKHFTFEKDEWNIRHHPFVVVNRLRSITQQLRYHSQSLIHHQETAQSTMKTFERLKGNKSSREDLPTGIGKPPECKSSSRRIPAPPPPSISFVVPSGTTPVRASPLSIFRRKPKTSLNDSGSHSTEIVSSNEALSPTDKDFKASSSSPPSAEYLEKHRPSCPSVSSTVQAIDALEASAVVMRDGGNKDRSKPLSRSSYHPNSTTNLLENPNPNSSRERGYGAVPTRASSSFTCTREKDITVYPTYCPKRRLRGPYGQLLESKMRHSNADCSDCESTSSEPPGLISKLTNGSNWTSFIGTDSMARMAFTEELLRETMKRRKELDQTGKNTPERTDSQAESKSSSSENIDSKPKRPNTIALNDVQQIVTNDHYPDKEDTKTDNQQVNDHVGASFRCTVAQVETQFVAPDGTSIMDVIGQHLDTRTHIVGEMYDLEKSYCEFLRSLFNDLSTVEHSKENEQNRIIDIIVSRLPAVLEIHLKFLEKLRRRITRWASDSQIGDLFELFRTPIIDEFYEVMVNHLPDCLPILKLVWKLKSNVKNQVRCKIAPEDMLIRIIQRMPQYKTLLDRLLKNTPATHKDYESLKDAFALICRILERMNTEQSTAQTFERISNSNHNVSEITTPMPVHSSYQDKHVHLRVKDVEGIVDGLVSLNLRPDDPVHLFDNITIGKRKRSVLLLDTNILICENKRRIKSHTANSILDGRYKIEQNIEIEKIDLRCQCWQNFLQQTPSAGIHHPLSTSTPTTAILATPITSNSLNLISPVLSNTDSGSNTSHLKITNQLQQTVHSESISTNIGCCSCIETLEADVKTLTKLKSSINEISSLPIRKLMKDNLNEIQDTVYRQLMTMHTTILNCSLDPNVDLYQVSPCLNHTLTDQNLVELLRHFEQQSYKLNDNNHPSNTNNNNLNLNLLETFEHQTKYRLTHLRCPQHQPSIKPLQNITPLLSLSFSCSKKRAYFETVLLCLRAKLFKTRLVLNSVHSIPYEKTRLTLQFRCAGAALSTNNVWICTSDRGQAQISVLVLSNNNDVEHSIVSCNTVAANQILSISSVPGVGESSDNINYNVEKESDKEQESVKNDKDCDKNVDNSANNKPKETKDEKLRSNSIQVSSFFQNLKTNKPPSHTLHRNSKQFDPNTNLLQNSCSGENRPCSVKHPTMWFATSDQNLNIYSCFDNIRTGKHKLKIALDGQVHAIQYYSEKVFVALSNSTVAIFHRDATGFWQSQPTLIENTLCNKLCVVHNTSAKEQLWAASLNVVTIRDIQFNVVEETIHMHENEKIATMVSDGRTIVLTLVDSCDIYRYSTLPPYQHLCTISIGPFVDKALSSSDQIIRFHKLACLKISDLHAVQNRIWIGTSAGVLLVLDVSNTIHIVPDGFTGRVSFIVSTRLDNGQMAVLSGGDGRERFKTAPGTAISPMAGPAELYNFMSFCSSAPNSIPEQTSNSQGTSGTGNSPASISLPNSPLHSSHTAQIMIRRAIPSRSSQLSPSTSSVSRTSDGSMTSGVSSAGTILSCDSIETRELNNSSNNDPVHSPLRSGTATTGTPNSYSNTPTSANQTVEGDFHPTWGSEDSQSYLLVWKL